MAASDYQYEFDGLLMGRGTNYIIERVSGLLSLPDQTVGDVDLETSPGSNSGLVVLQHRVIEISLLCSAAPDADAEQKFDALRLKFMPQGRRNAYLLKTLRFGRPAPGAPGTTLERKIDCRVERFDFQSDYRRASGLLEGTIQLLAPDPILYDVNEKTTSITLATSATTGNVTVSGSGAPLGTHPDGVGARIIITGPSRNPVVSEAAGITDALTMTGDIAAGQELRIDTAKRTVELWASGSFVSDASSYITSSNIFWKLRPAPSVLFTYSRNSGLVGAPSTATIKWNDGWA